MTLVVDDGDDGPVDPEEGAYLLPHRQDIVLRSELFLAEAMNLAEALVWLREQEFTRDVLLSAAFQHELHWQMYGQVWSWAGRRRTRENNIGVPPEAIADRWTQLLGNVGYWLDNGVFPPDEACLRYYHEQREIQPFHDGNSRLGRVVVNALAVQSGMVAPGRVRYPFGRGGDPDEARAAYLTAIACARRGDFGPLVKFALSGTEPPGR